MYRFIQRLGDFVFKHRRVVTSIPPVLGCWLVTFIVFLTIPVLQWLVRAFGSG